ncbi:hypothetical protein [Gilliamella sp. wkB308]|uniref:hypothetical protein n=1 Tax=Gilliamella sp. wkB308 TaxID=3120263 RepID=UPI00080EC7EA|nr:hypothetical protein [Gilliamella apicola]OCF95796.1 hypothetical protein A9G10_09885 [Gilliamella apicola]
MPSQYLLINRYPVKKEKGQEIETFALNKSKDLINKHSFYISDDKEELIEFIALGSLNELADYEKSFAQAFTEYANYLCGDIKRELLFYVESPIRSVTVIPQTNFVQLRHVEVLPTAYNAYLKWRNETIFNVVKSNINKITSFDAYHSLISQIPGVMFISCFNGAIEDYMKPFTDEHYKTIVAQAGDSYITGGKEGLYTKIYRKLGN